MSLPSFSTPFSQGEPSFEDEMCEMCPKLTYQQRLVGFCSMCGFGYMLSFVASMMLAAEGPTKDAIRNFAALYIVGNFIAIGATGFLIGPRRQCKKMCDKSRRFSCMFWITTLIVTFAIAVAGVDVGYVIMMVFIQIAAGIWYSASYIPYGRRMIIKIFQSTCCAPCPKVCEPVIKIAT
mmetsp:Transcript_25566/g.78817  ORF Transcript_25566/g.78817 Transcript_25566/m.78817 type:complete len:179 (+) Transcript_25566:176-712(+)